MKRSHIPVIGMLACIGALAAAHDESAKAVFGHVPAIRAESAGGNVSLRAAGNDDEKERARAKVREHAAGTYIPEMLLARDSTLARWRARSRPITVWVQSRPDLDDWAEEYVDAVSEAFMSW